MSSTPEPELTDAADSSVPETETERVLDDVEQVRE
jgi:hypothetical protein